MIKKYQKPVLAILCSIVVTLGVIAIAIPTQSAESAPTPLKGTVQKGINGTEITSDGDLAGICSELNTLSFESDCTDGINEGHLTLVNPDDPKGKAECTDYIVKITDLAPDGIPKAGDYLAIGTINDTEDAFIVIPPFLDKGRGDGVNYATSIVFPFTLDDGNEVDVIIFEADPPIDEKAFSQFRGGKCLGP